MKGLAAVPCPCGFSRRAFTDDPAQRASFHIVDIKKDSETHYHKRQTEIYFVLKGRGRIEADGESIPVKPGDAIMIKPGCRHRPVGSFTITNVVFPAFDPADEYVVPRIKKKTTTSKKRTS